MNKSSTAMSCLFYLYLKNDFWYCFLKASWWKFVFAFVFVYVFTFVSIIFICPCICIFFFDVYSYMYRCVLLFPVFSSCRHPVGDSYGRRGCIGYNLAAVHPTTELPCQLWKDIFLNLCQPFSLQRQKRGRQMKYLSIQVKSIKGKRSDDFHPSSQ